MRHEAPTRALGARRSRPPLRSLALATILLAALAGCLSDTYYGSPSDFPAAEPDPAFTPARVEGQPYQVGILLLDGVYNSELAAPYEILHHAVFTNEPKPGTWVFTVGRSLDPLRTLEGIAVLPDFDLEECPRIDILVVPGCGQNTDSALADRRLVRWIAEKGERATFVVSLSDGAFLLAEAGLLTGRECTTHPQSVAPLGLRHPELKIVEGVSFVVDGSVVTSVGGAASYEPALYVTERLFGRETAEEIARALLLDWDLDSVLHRIAGEETQTPEPESPEPADAQGRVLNRD
jgi:transcriptional regulator GlxA family with amidase domain